MPQEFDGVPSSIGMYELAEELASEMLRGPAGKTYQRFNMEWNRIEFEEGKPLTPGEEQNRLTSIIRELPEAVPVLNRLNQITFKIYNSGGES